MSVTAFVFPSYYRMEHVPDAYQLEQPQLRHLQALHWERLLTLEQSALIERILHLHWQSRLCADYYE